MLPDFGALEMVVVAIVALIVVGPKDLPVLLRKLGQFVAKMRGLAAEFRASFDEMARQSELDDLRKEVEALKNQRIDAGIDASFTRDIEAELGDINHDLNLNPHLTATDPEAAHDAHWPEDQGHPFFNTEPEPSPKARKPRAKKVAAPADAPPARKAAQPKAIQAKTGAAKPKTARKPARKASVTESAG